jgi:hypothetical protein
MRETGMNERNRSEYLYLGSFENLKIALRFMTSGGELGGLVAKASASKGRSTRFKSRRGKSFSESVGIFS